MMIFEEEMWACVQKCWSGMSCSSSHHSHSLKIRLALSSSPFVACLALPAVTSAARSPGSSRMLSAAGPACSSTVTGPGCSSRPPSPASCSPSQPPSPATHSSFRLPHSAACSSSFPATVLLSHHDFLFCGLFLVFLFE